MIEMTVIDSDPWLRQRPHKSGSANDPQICTGSKRAALSWIQDVVMRNYPTDHTRRTFRHRTRNTNSRLSFSKIEILPVTRKESDSYFFGDDPCVESHLQSAAFLFGVRGALAGRYIPGLATLVMAELICNIFEDQLLCVPDDAPGDNPTGSTVQSRQAPPFSLNFGPDHQCDSELLMLIFHL